MSTRMARITIGAGLLLALILLAGCIAGGTVPVYRIGLVAPFEGRYRELGYDVIYAARLALREALDAGAMPGYRVELVAYDDTGDPEQAMTQARALVVDPAVRVVIGHWRAETTRAASPVYQAAGLPLITPDGDATAVGAEAGVFVLDARPETKQAALDAYLDAQGLSPSSVYFGEPVPDVTEAASLARAADVDLRIGGADWGTGQFRELTRGLEGDVWFVTSAAWPADLPNGTAFREMLLASGPYVPEPGPLAPLAYDAVRLTLVAIARAYSDGSLTREAVAAALAVTDFDGLIGRIAFDGDRFWQSAPLYLYRWGDEGVPGLVARLQ